MSKKEMDGPMMGRCMEHLMGDGYSESEAHEMCLLIMEGEEGKDAAASGRDAAIRVAQAISGGYKSAAGALAVSMEPEANVKFYVAEMKAHKNGDVEAYISTETPDRVGDILKAKGWVLDNYRKTGSPVLFGHEYGITFGGHIPHIGNAVEMEVQRKGLWSVTRFHEKTALSREAALLARERLMPSWSVGFNPLEPPTTREEDGEVKGFIFGRQELLEYSLVPVPANAEAVSKAIFMARKGVISMRTASLFAGPAPLANTDSDAEAKAVRELFQAERLGIQFRGL